MDSRHCEVLEDLSAQGGRRTKENAARSSPLYGGEACRLPDELKSDDSVRGECQIVSGSPPNICEEGPIVHGGRGHNDTPASEVFEPSETNVALETNSDITLRQASIHVSKKVQKGTG